VAAPRGGRARDEEGGACGVAVETNSGEGCERHAASVAAAEEDDAGAI